LFVGDSTIRQVYWAVARKLDRQRAAEMFLSAEKHGSLEFEQGRVKIQFLWDPFLNSTRLRNELHRSKMHAVSSNSTRIAAMLVGTGLWHAKDLDATFLDGFKQSIDGVANFLPHNAKDTNGVLLPPRARAGANDLVLFAPVPLPTQSRLDMTRAAKLTPRKVKAMNDYLGNAASRDQIEVLWSYSSMTWQRPSAHEENGIHVVENVADRQADVFLNMRCDSEQSLAHYPFDKTCCNFQPPVNLEQQLLVLIAALTTLYALYASIKLHFHGPGPSVFWTHSVTAAAATLAVAILYCFVADRMLIFDRVQKVLSERTFLQSMGLTMLGGLITIRRSGNRSTETSAKLYMIAPVPTFLSRDQTDEWKGWMQFVILFYHYTGMSSVLWVYQIVRLLVASYLFMTGYGHTIYFLKTNDFSLRRVTSVLLRLNLLSCLLAYFLRTDYSLYYFPAVSSFWFLVVYLTVRIRHRPNVVPRLLTLKIFMSALLTQLLVRAPGVLEGLFDFLEKACYMNLDAEEFRFRLSLDAYIVYVGMFAATIYLQVTGAAPCSTTCLATQIKRIPTTAHVLTVIASTVILPAYFIVIRRCPNKYDYNRWHPIVSPLPVLAFAVLRNATQALRDCHSQLFAWLGRCSLETFILQYHIWLAGDTKVLLSLGLWTRDSVIDANWSDNLGWFCEFALITSFFLWTSWAVGTATNLLALSIAHGKEDTPVSGLLKRIGWRKTSDNPNQGQISTLPRGDARDTSNRIEGGHGGKEGMTMPISGNGEGSSPSSDSGLRIWIVAILLLMWVGNWVSCHVG
jgi:N-acetylneuraminate 9-O-acetyltransferase